LSLFTNPPQYDAKLGTTKEAWKAKQLKITQRYPKAYPLADQIKNRETVANTGKHKLT
jgi:hypothetical protein